MLALKVERLRKVYGSGTSAVLAVEDLTFDVRAGEFLCIVGPSGCGKTTLLKMISGLLNPSAGTVHLGDQQISGPPEQMALVFQDYSRSLLPWMTVWSNVTLPLLDQVPSNTDRTTRASEALEAVDLTEFRDLYPWQLSGGMQQRVAIARALAYQASVLLMDEPFASVDAQTRWELEDLVLHVHATFGMTAVFVTHDIDESVYLADRVVVLDKGPTSVKEIVEVGLPRPRHQVETRASAEFIAARSHILRLIRENHEASAG